MKRSEMIAAHLSVLRTARREFMARSTANLDQYHGQQYKNRWTKIKQKRRDRYDQPIERCEADLARAVAAEAYWEAVTAGTEPGMIEVY